MAMQRNMRCNWRRDMGGVADLEGDGIHSELFQDLHLLADVRDFILNARECLAEFSCCIGPQPTARRGWGVGGQQREGRGS
jgi:hypothetical protein